MLFVLGFFTQFCGNIQAAEGRRKHQEMCVQWRGEGKTDNKIDLPLNAYSPIYVFDNETEMPLALRKQQLHNQEGRAE